MSARSALLLMLVSCSHTSKPPTVAELQASEATSCAGIDATTRLENPLTRENVARVEPLVQQTPTRKTVGPTVGAIVVVHARPGVTAESLQQRIQCYAAHARASGTIASSDPVLVPDSTVRVRATKNGFAVEIRSNDRDAAREILARAEQLETSSVARP